MRRHSAVFVGAGALALVLTACGGGGGDTESGASGDSSEPTKIDFVLNYTPGPQHTEFVVAESEGYWEDAGLDVNMTSPAATTDPIRLVASGKADIGLGYAGDVLTAASQDIPVVSVATIHRHLALGLMSKAGSGITSPESLKGKTVGLTPIPSNRALFDEFLAANGVDESEVEVVTVNFNGPQLVAAGEIDAADSVAWYENPLYEQTTGEAPEFVKFTDHGVPDSYYLSIITSQRFLNENPEAVEKFVAATLEAEKWTLENPEEAQKIVTTELEDVSPEFAAGSRAALEDVIVDDASQENGLGWADEAVWQEQADFFEETGQIERSVTVSEVFTNDYLPEEPITVDVPQN